MPLSKIKTNSISNPVALTAPVIDGAGYSQFQFRNKLINGDMRIDQRNAGSSVTASAGTAYAVDRWKAYNNGGSTKTHQQSSVVPNGNFSKSIVATVTVTGTPSESAITQTIEGYNITDFGFGTANAATLTASFWVRSSVTGVYCFSLRQGSGARSFVSPFTINSANTWEYKTIVIPGDTSGSYDSTNGAGFIFEVCLGATSLLSTVTNAWVAGNYVATSAQTNLASTNGATFYITGAQLEKGSVATPFETRPHGLELTLCKRYYEKPTAYMCSTSNMYANYRYYNGVSFSVEKRASPTVTVLQTYNEYPGGATRSVSPSVVDNWSWAVLDTVASATLMTVQISASAEI